jgi:hypothetical protein
VDSSKLVQDELAPPFLSFISSIEYSPLNRKILESSIKDYLIFLVSAQPISGDSEISPGDCVGRRPVPWLLVPGPVVCVEQLRANPGYL